ncbi:MAG: UPF0175 family protein [Planctomycetes bacterium]|nr:UPF0175 family protein [Planctomycetota bacterium]NUQ34048.1 UPF0175 family protein [Planctomycetaceae bacterium]
MTDVSVAFPDSLLTALRKAPHEAAAEVRFAAAAHWYQQGVISMERAAELAGMSRPEFIEELARRHIDVIVVDTEDLRAELKDV